MKRDPRPYKGRQNRYHYLSSGKSRSLQEGNDSYYNITACQGYTTNKSILYHVNVARVKLVDVFSPFSGSLSFICTCWPAISYFLGLPIGLPFSVRSVFFKCCKWAEMCGRGLILAHSSAVRALAQFSKEKQSPLNVMKSHILFSWLKVLVESGLLKLRAYEILTTGCSHGQLSINVCKMGNPQL